MPAWSELKKESEVLRSYRGNFWAYCPGCKKPHRIPVQDPAPPSPRWEFDGNMEKPTFKPSLLLFYEVDGQRQTICHSFITEGRWIYLGDCRHELAGQTVDLPSWPSELDA